MTKLKQDFEIFEGAVRSVDAIIYEGDSTTRQDLTAVTSIRWRVDALALEKAIGTGILVTDALNGEIRISMDAADTKNKKGAYYHECRVVIGGSSDVVFHGTMTVRESKTD